VVIALRCPAARKPGVAFHGHPFDACVLPMATRSTHASHPWPPVRRMRLTHGHPRVGPVSRGCPRVRQAPGGTIILRRSMTAASFIMGIVRTASAPRPASPLGAIRLTGRGAPASLMFRNVRGMVVSRNAVGTAAVARLFTARSRAHQPRCSPTCRATPQRPPADGPVRR
jgi:hypothetical protein